jgi:O-antigen/teichoic acid export membrane protein
MAPEKGVSEEGPNPTPGRARRVAWNSFSLSGAEILSRFFTWLTILFLVRHWNLDYYGQYAVAISWVTILSAFNSLGLNTLTVKEVSHDKRLSNFFLGHVVAIRSASSIFFVLVLAVVGHVLNYEPVLRVALVILGLRLVLDAVSSAYNALLQAHEMMGIQGLVSLVGAFLRMIGIILAVYFGGRMVSACWVWVGVGAITLLFLWDFGKRHAWRIDWDLFQGKKALELMRRSIPFAAFGTIQILYYRVDGVILKSLAGNEAVAFYDVAGRLLFVVYMIADHFGISTLPSFSSAQDNREDLSRIATRALKAMLLLGLPLTVGGFFLADPLMVFLFGRSYSASGPVFALLSLSIVLYFCTKPCVNLLAVKDPFKLSYVFLGLFLANVALNFFLIPRWGMMGAAFNSVFCEVLAILACGWLTFGYFRFSIDGFFRSVFAGFLACALMGIGIHWSPGLYWLGLGPVVFGSSLFLFGGFNHDDLENVRSIFRKKIG